MPSFSVISSVDGSYQKKCEFLESLPDGHLPMEMKLEINQKANQRFQESPSKLIVGDLICTLELGNNCLQYKIYEVNDDTVVIAVRDLVMHVVPKSSLYDPEVCEEIFWAGPYGVE